MRHFIESLEPRRLLSGYPLVVRSLPFSLDFASSKGWLTDKDGQGTGFTWAQTNASGNEYQPGKIDLDTSAGVLKITSSGNSSAGGNYNTDNSLVDGLQTSFNATVAGGWSVTTRLLGPLSYIDQPNEQAGILIGPDSDHYVKLVAVANASLGQTIQFLDEQGSGNHALGGNGVTVIPGSFASINTLDLTLTGDFATGIITAFYAVNGGTKTQVQATLGLSGTQKTTFFGTNAKAGIVVMHKNNLAPPTATFDSFAIEAGALSSTNPSVTGSRPSNGNTNVRRDAFVAADVHIPTAGAGIDPGTLTSSTVKLYRTSDKASVAAVLNTSGGGDAIVLTPSDFLASNTKYTFEVTSGLKDLTGASFFPYKADFTTGTLGGPSNSNVMFEQVALPTAQNQSFTGVAIGPDSKLYGWTLSGQIFRWSINGDGTLGAAQQINTVKNNNGGARAIIGLTFDPASTANNLIAWVTHSDAALENATDYTGKLSRLSGANLEIYQDEIVNLPRSIRDHQTNQCTFGPDGLLYFPQASMSAMGAPDNAWGLRSEHLLNAAILTADTAALEKRISDGKGPLNAKTDNGGSYDPFASGAPLKIYATGVRNAYDLLFHSNGLLYAPTNGSAAGGNTPAGGGAPALTNVSTTQDDFIFRIQQGGYYGHPNPPRNQFVLNGGNPTSGVDPAEVTQYPVGTQPDPDYKGFAYDVGKNYSPDGVIEYQGSAFGGALNKKVMIARYSGGDDIIILDAKSNGSLANIQTGIVGLTHFVDPLDLCEDPNTGNLYVVEHGANRITLVRPLDTGQSPASPAAVTVAPSSATVSIATARLFSDTTINSNSLGSTVLGESADTTLP
jgi:glucose/arabinose dehydrogenase